MRLVLLSLFALFTLNAFAGQIDQSTLDRIARDIDNICGDTYCEGDYNWNHENLKCDLNKGQCTLDMQLIDHNYLPNNATLTSYYSKTCIINGLFTVTDVVSARNTYSEKLMDGVYACVEKMESEYRSFEN